MLHNGGLPSMIGRFVSSILPKAPAPKEDWMWSLSETDLRPLIAPRRGALHVRLPLATVLERIAAFMRLKSIACEVNDKEAAISCITPHHNHFVVYLWRLGKEDDTIVVDVERRAGCSVYVQRLRQGLYTMIEHNEPSSSLCQGESCHTFIPKNICPLVKRLYDDRRKDVSQRRSCKEGMFKALRLLESESDDQRRLGMEHLAYLTNLDKVDAETAGDVARALIYHEDDCPSAESLRQHFVSFFDESKLVLLTPNSEEVETTEYAEAHQFTVMHSLALETLTNAIGVLVGDEVSSQKIDLATQFWLDVTHALVNNLVQAIERPQDAAMSAKCLVLLDDMVPHATDILVRDRMLPFVVRAHKFGEAHHLSLERETQLLLSKLSSYSSID